MFSRDAKIFLGNDMHHGFAENSVLSVLISMIDFARCENLMMVVLRIHHLCGAVLLCCDPMCF